MDLFHLKKLALFGIAMGFAAQPIAADALSLDQGNGMFVAGCGNDSCRSLPPPPNPAYPPSKPPSNPSSTRPKLQPENQTARYFQQRSREIADESMDEAPLMRKKPETTPQKPAEGKIIRYYQKRDSRQITEEEEQTITPPPKGAWKNHPNGTRTWQNAPDESSNSPSGEMKGYSNGTSPNNSNPQPETKTQNTTYRPNTWYNGAK